MDCAMTLRELYPKLLAEDRRALEAFLRANSLAYEEDIGYAVCLADENGAIHACGCSAGNILKGFAADEGMRGQNVLSRLLPPLIAERFRAGVTGLFIYTGADSAGAFMHSGFYMVASSGRAALLENDRSGVERFLKTVPAFDDGVCGAAVINANPFTLGHLHLLEHAAARCDRLYAFVVSEERSEFPFSVRMELVRRGTEHLKNIYVCSGGPYMISQATFPAYFLRRDEDAAAIQAELDLEIFCRRIAPPLRITKRFIGEEPISGVTAAYNRTMRAILPCYGIAVDEIPRLLTGDGEAISASAVREGLMRRCPGDWLYGLVPSGTAEYLLSHQGQPCGRKGEIDGA